MEQFGRIKWIFVLVDRLFGRIIRHVSFRRKLIFFFLLVSLGPILIIGSIVYSTSRQAIKNKITDYSIDSLTKSKQHMELVIKKYEDLSYNFMAVNDINQLFINIGTADDYERFVAMKELENYLTSLCQGDKNLVTVRFTSTEGATINVGKRFTDLFTTVFPEAESNETVSKAQGRIVWFSPIKASTTREEYLLVMGRMIRNPRTGEVLGNVFFFIAEASIDQYLNEYFYSIGGVTEEKISVSYTMLIDQEGLIVSSPYKDQINQNVFDLLKTKKHLRALMEGEELAPSFNDVLAGEHVQITVKEFGQNWYLLGIAPTSYLYRETRMVGLITAVLVVVAGIIAVLISLYVSITISDALDKVVRGMGRMEEGDLTVRVDVETEDELGLLAKGFNRMVERVAALLVATKEAISDVKDRSGIMESNSVQTVEAAHHVAAAMTEISKGTMEQTTEAEKASKLMADLASLIDDTIGKTGEVKRITSSTRSLSVNTQEAIKGLIEKAKLAEEITQTIVGNIDQLDTSARQISKITEVITNIAEQTNLLALNAAIEAARAGEAGRGFAVVANEVNKLAAQTQEAVRMIEGILKTIEGHTKVSKVTAEEVYKVVDEQNSAVTMTRGALEQVVVAMDNVVKQMSVMTENISSINDFKEQTIKAIINISAISEETAAFAEEVSASSEQQTGMAETTRNAAEALHQMADLLVETISHFVFEEKKETGREAQSRVGVGVGADQGAKGIKADGEDGTEGEEEAAIEAEETAEVEFWTEAGEEEKVAAGQEEAGEDGTEGEEEAAIEAEETAEVEFWTEVGEEEKVAAGQEEAGEDGTEGEEEAATEAEETAEVEFWTEAGEEEKVAAGQEEAGEDGAEGEKEAATEAEETAEAGLRMETEVEARVVDGWEANAERGESGGEESLKEEEPGESEEERKEEE
jgi:methyl-accepting chemotaxis protein